jgi:hypothetical protein
MEKIKKLIVPLLMLGMVFLTTSCEPDSYSLGDKLDKSQIDFDITQDFSVDPGGNTVILTNKTPGTILTWDYVTGKSNKSVETVKYAFKGDYTINISAVTAGGIVQLDPVTITVTDDNLSYVNDPLWILLSGGVGNSKTWVLDLDAEGVSKYFGGPMFFYGSDNSWLEGGDAGCYGEDCWNWSPDWKGNEWLFVNGAEDFGSMTFSLEGGNFVTVDNLSTDKLDSGTYFLDKDAHTLTFTDATMLHDSGSDGLGDFSNVKIFSLTENTMQLGVFRSGDPATLVYNFITKEYSDNWEPVEEVATIDEGFDPQFAPGELLKMLTGGTSSGRVWELDASGNPIDWLAGGIGWTVDSSSSNDWGWNDNWSAAVDGAWIRFDQWGGLNYTRYQNGAETTGTFSIDEESNEITLVGNTLLQEPGSGLNPTTNVIKVVKAYNADFETKGIWFGTSYDETKDEWFVFHYVVPQN